MPPDGSRGQSKQCVGCVGALAARAAVIGAGMNVKINASSLKDRKKAEALIAEADAIIEKANAAEKEITQEVDKKIKG